MADAADFIAPTGQIEPGTWPTGDAGGDTTARLEAWIAAAEAATANVESGSLEKAISAYVYGKAFRAMAQRLAEAPSTARQEDISHQISQGQITYFRQLAEQYEAEFLGYLPVADLPPSTPPTSYGVSNNFVW
jgi:hypothetical protein